MSSEATPMFPLGSVLLPSMMLPLHIFEERYRRMIDDVLHGDGTFGVTMIERGSEVGGSDVRAVVGCRAQVLEAEEQPDGRWHVIAVGTERITVEEWLPDDPYPRAVVAPFPDRAGSDGSDQPFDGALFDTMFDDPRWLELDSEFRTLLRLVARVTGSDLPVDLELADDPATATFQMAAVAPLGPLDRYRVLAADHPDLRRTLLLDAFAHITVLVNDATTN